MRIWLKRERMAALSISPTQVREALAANNYLAAVYAPIGLQGALTGALFREFALTLAGAVFISRRSST